jgi:hypothetical protein
MNVALLIRVEHIYTLRIPASSINLHAKYINKRGGVQVPIGTAGISARFEACVRSAVAQEP